MMLSNPLSYDHSITYVTSTQTNTTDDGGQTDDCSATDSCTDGGDGNSTDGGTDNNGTDSIDDPFNPDGGTSADPVEIPSYIGVDTHTYDSNIIYNTSAYMPQKYRFNVGARLGGTYDGSTTHQIKFELVSKTLNGDITYTDVPTEE